MEGQIGPQGKILVFVRVRPLNDKEARRNDVVDWECSNDTTIIYKNNFGPDRSMYPSSYSFDRVFGPSSSTRQVYQEGAKAIALSAVGGINANAFAYGQTSSGKTYTMTGITEYAMADIFDYIRKHNEREFLLKFSAMEIYNESVRDLLSLESTPLRLLDDPERGTVVDKLTEEVVRNWDHLQELLSICKAQRQIGETFMNESSSRSHQIIRLTIESYGRELPSEDNLSVLVATVNFIDLAGSERASQSFSASSRLKEGSYINRSLLTLGTVIRKRSKGRNAHIPYRDSKLTRILQSSLGGNARTAIICTMSPARSYVEQSRNTLLFATSAKQVTTNAKVNLQISDKALVKHLQKELVRLENELRNAKSSPRSDSTSLLREKDLLIEKLERQVRELVLQRDLALSNIKDVHLEVEDDKSSVGQEPVDLPYPKLHVRQQSWASQTTHTSTVPDLHSIDSSSMTIETPHSSGSYSWSGCDENYFFSDFEDDFLPRIADQPASFESSYNSSPRSFIQTSVYVKTDQENAGQTDESTNESCVKDRCIEPEEPIMSDVEISSIPVEENRDILSLKVDVNPETSLQDPELSLSVHEREQTGCHADLGTCSLQKPSSWDQNHDVNDKENLSLDKSSSSEIDILGSSPSFQQPELVKEEIQLHHNKHSVGSYQELTEKLQDAHKKLYVLGNDADNETLFDKVLISSDASSVLEETQAPDVKVMTDEVILNKDSHIAETKETTYVQCKKETMVLLEENVSQKAENSIKNMKDVGFQYDLDNAQWPTNFKRRQREVIDLWHVCNASLMYRTYFFLLFEGDPEDAIYMEVERRRLSFIKGNGTVLDGQAISPSLSKKHLQQERHMLSKLLKSRISKHERESLYVKWGIPLDTKKRSFQLAQQLWTITEDMAHIEASARVVATLIKFDKRKIRKEMFGLNLMPTLKGSGSYVWKHSATVLF